MTSTATAQELIVNALHQNRSPDEIVNEISGGLQEARIVVGQVMKSRAAEARRLMDQIRRENEVSRVGKWYDVSIRDYYKKKDKWLYWRRKWGLSHTLEGPDGTRSTNPQAMAGVFVLADKSE